MIDNRKLVCVIPARMGSSRYPGKPLAPLLGLPLVLHVLDRCRLYEKFDAVVVATCDTEILDAVEAHGGRAVMTADTHERCTDRTEEAIDELFPDLADDAIVVMVQGDEILVSPDMIAQVADAFVKADADVVNLASRLYTDADHDDPNTVKVVAAPDGRALYFSRSPIPSRARVKEVAAYQQTGIIAFTKGFLKTFSELPQTPLEKIESCDMMRVVEHGRDIRLVHTETETIGVDTPADLRRAEGRLRDDSYTARYMTLPAAE
ncbi:MAG: 3-deoxy-manno-octulosonate cytidylyltransferase [Rhodospirillales bacterium]